MRKEKLSTIEPQQIRNSGPKVLRERFKHYKKITGMHYRNFSDMEPAGPETARRLAYTGCTDKNT